MELTEIERSINKKFRKEIFCKVVEAIKEFNLVEDNDKIAVCISGGKDSFLLAKCLQELQKHKQISYELKFIVMNPGYNQKNLSKLIENAKVLNLDIEIFNTDIFEIVKNDTKDNPCYLCARMRRGYLYSYAQKLGCNKIALGHHFNDVIETVLMNMFYNGTYSGMLPILNSDHFENMQLIRPLYYVKESSIIKWSKYTELTFLDCACSVTKKKIGTRREVKELIKKINEMYDKADVNIMNSLKNVNLNTILSTKSKNQEKN